nr:TCDD-inducible poly [ADP-ribose] polymerase-like [Pelodiscus sinensis]|eukprot:XP_006116247.1 TCDD-inducible poly [ADP-ribose] polymerase-like [Pelodiscus sinensis]
MAASNGAPTAPPPTQLKHSRRKALRRICPIILRNKAHMWRLQHHPPELGSVPRAPGSPPTAPATPTSDPYGEIVELALGEVEVAPEPAQEPGPGCEELTLDHLLEIVAQLEYHTHPEDGVDICPRFLLGCCFSGTSCPQHHTLLPYHWQLRESTGWRSVGPDAHETLERFYSDPERTRVRASYQDVAFDIDLVTMQVQNSPHFTRIRRLSTSAASGTPFSTTLQYYWQGLGSWEPYSTPFTEHIEAALQSGQQEVLCSTAEHSYQLHLQAGCQRNLATGTLRPLQARPVFRAPALLLPELRTLSGSLYLPPPPAPGPPVAQPYPETWVPLTPEQDWHKVPMSIEDRGFRLIYGLFHKSLPEARYRLLQVWRVPCTCLLHRPQGHPWHSPTLRPGCRSPRSRTGTRCPCRSKTAASASSTASSTRACPRHGTACCRCGGCRTRVQNPFLWDKYKRKQSHMSRQMSPEQQRRNERHLFHGTSAGAVPAICKHNLDPRLSGKHAAIYGQGSYFARRASYSHRYAPPSEAGLRHVFLCKVLVGRWAQGQAALPRPPPLDAGDPASNLYDSCVDNLSDPQIYVVFDNDQCYPYFLIQYRELEDVVAVD